VCETLRGAQEAEGAGGVGGPLARGGGQACEILLDDPLDAVDIEEVEGERALTGGLDARPPVAIGERSSFLSNFAMTIERAGCHDHKCRAESRRGRHECLRHMC